jgi:hypothetical protein
VAECVSQNDCIAKQFSDEPQLITLTNKNPHWAVSTGPAKGSIRPLHYDLPTTIRSEADCPYASAHQGFGFFFLLLANGEVCNHLVCLRSLFARKGGFRKRRGKLGVQIEGRLFPVIACDQLRCNRFSLDKSSTRALVGPTGTDENAWTRITASNPPATKTAAKRQVLCHGTDSDLPSPQVMHRLG